MAFFLKEAVLLMIVATVISLPWRPFDTTTIDEPTSETEEEVYPGVGTKREATANDETPTEIEEEVYPGVGTKRGTESTQEDQTLPDTEGVVYPGVGIQRALRAKRGATLKANSKWDKQGDVVIIKYAFNTADDVNAPTKRWLKDIFRELEITTCIRFQADENNPNVYFKKGAGCSSKIGKIKSSKTQDVNLCNPGCDNRGTIMHEIMHLLGFEHEHQRNDRDNFIVVHNFNIQTGLDSQFKKKDQDTSDPYDTSSIMEYNEYAFSKDPKKLKTMEAKSGNKRLGQLAHMDASDVMKINKLYACKPSKKYNDVIITLTTGSSVLDGTNADVYIGLTGKGGIKTEFELVTEGGAIGDENEQGAVESHNMAIEDTGKIESVEVALVESGADPPKRGKKRKRGQKKRWFWNTDGWTLEKVVIKIPVNGITQTFGPKVELYPGDIKKLEEV